jgi:hypothetical protein
MTQDGHLSRMRHCVVSWVDINVSNKHAASLFSFDVCRVINCPSFTGSCNESGQSEMNPGPCVHTSARKL